MQTQREYAINHYICPGTAHRTHAQDMCHEPCHLSPPTKLWVKRQAHVRSWFLIYIQGYIGRGWIAYGVAQHDVFPHRKY